MYLVSNVYNGFPGLNCPDFFRSLFNEIAFPHNSREGGGR